MRRLVLLVALGLAACGHKATEETQTTVTKNGVTTTTITRRSVDGNRTVVVGDERRKSGLDIDSDKVTAKVEIPGLTFGGDHVDMAGMKLYPGSTVTGVHVHAIDRGADQRGQVEIDYSSPAAPAVVARHMADEARRSGFALTVDSPTAVGGSKRSGAETSTFAMTFNPNGVATDGQLTMTGTKR